MECEDCGDTCKRRTRCPNCKKLVCSWCYHHTHMLETEAKDSCEEPEAEPLDIDDFFDFEHA